MDVYNGELYLHHLESIVREMSPTLVLVSHTSQGMDYAPALAARLSAACITGVNGIRTDENGDVLYSRGICNGSFNTLIRPATALTVVTAQPGYFPAESWDGASGAVSVRTVTREPSAIRCTGIEKNPSSSSELGNARIIVSAGRGIGTQENLDVIRRFAACFPGAAVGGSRPLIDMGWMEYRHQVGITGAVVSPAVYIACGISGSTQHIAGMNTSGYVVSINSDPNAAIFNVSDLCVVDDVIGFIEAFETVIREDAL
jgi:electron transfer flavoprotein alpha subunit